MKNRHRMGLAMLAAGLLGVTSFATRAGAQDNNGLPPVSTQGEVSYISGGVGLDESQALRREAPHWPLALRFTGSRNEYLADVQVTITRASGQSVLDTISQGPYMLIKLAPGRYTVRAQYKDAAQTKSIELRRHATLAFRWSQP
ncbi:carboxypeptidase-like regulatory domain-containing protein [Mycetohabitans sp. B46]|uniref:carboxypeptidase-like regulatory domain-containing protein n=1 Tax=Mycetohabitans sp. B46 TaxID=2772536 RepID=UPI00307FCB73